jgi:hypothetical protein
MHVNPTHSFLVLPTAGSRSQFVLLFTYIFIYLVIAVDSSDYQHAALNVSMISKY